MNRLFFAVNSIFLGLGVPFEVPPTDVSINNGKTNTTKRAPHKSSPNVAGGCS